MFHVAVNNTNMGSKYRYSPNDSELNNLPICDEKSRKKLLIPTTIRFSIKDNFTQARAFVSSFGNTMA